MGRLIDAEDFSKVMKDYFTDMITHHKYNVDCVECNANLQRLLDEQPTAYDVDKVVEELKEVHKNFCNSVTCGGKAMCKDCEEYVMFQKNIEIVKQGGVSDDVCEWKLEDEEANLYVTKCQQRHLIFEGTPKDNGYTYCPYCGKKIKVVDNDK